MKLVPLFITTLALVAARPATAAPLKSPYFIDGIHCEGLEEGVNTDHIINRYPDPEVQAVAEQLARQSYCEAVFGQFGVQKFQWLTPEDLENLSFTMRHSGRFAAVDIRLEKSELPNHVHLIGTFQMYESRTHATVALKSTLERGSALSGDRRTDEVHGAVEFGKRGDTNPAAAVLSVDGMQTTAPKPLALTELAHSSTPVTLTPDEAAAEARQDGTYAGINLRLNMPRRHVFEQFIDIGFSSTNMEGDLKHTFDTKVQAGASIDTDKFIPSKLSLLLLYGTYQATAAQKVVSEDSPGNKSILFAGVADSVRSRRFNVDLDLYRSLTSDIHYFYDANILWKAGHAVGIDHGFGVEQHMIEGAVLPEQRFGLPNRDEVYLFYRAAVSFNALGGEQTLAFKIGQATYTAEDDTDTPYARSSPYGEIDYVTQTSGIDVSLGFMYGKQRLY